MTRLAIEQAPAVSLPRRFLLSAPLWGATGGALLIVYGDGMLHTRWSPATVAWVHVFTLGVLGNTMLGSLLQFLPAAAAVRVAGGARTALTLHALFNLGIGFLIAGLLMGWRPGLIGAALLLPASFLLLSAMTWPGLLAVGGDLLLRMGIAMALGFALLTASIGGWLALGLGGWLSVPLPALADVHASFGLLGWTIVLLASVARVVMPMFQGTGMTPRTYQAIWLGSLTAMLLVGAWQRLVNGQAAWLTATIVIHASLFALAALWLQWRAPSLRKNALMYGWRCGLVALVLCAVMLPGDPRGGLLVGAVGVGFALPLLVVGMALEIVAFLGWIELHRRCGRGIRLPGVQRLLPAADKARALMMLLPCALITAAAVYWPTPWLARSAGVATTMAWLLLWHAMYGVHRRVRLFLHAADGSR